ncbi:MAG: LysR family transcriptional regulator [Alphaproteobacteria bacterium]|nr:LysR family transcriptional regulator [Alphaproteobacteria bacterium]
MTDWLPSLNALRAFEAVCRHLNYVYAAAELGVTPAAVKQLVRKLEEAVGTKLVERSGRGLAVTPAGHAAAESLSSGFQQIARAVEKIRAHPARQRLIVSVEPSFATAWLVPRLERFRRSTADVDVLIDSSLKIANLEQGEADIAIRFGGQAEEPLIVHRLFDEQLCAFCSPSLVGGEHGLYALDDLENATLLHWDLSDLTWAAATRKWMGWKPWLERVGARQIDWQRGVRFSDYNLAVQAAIAGQGVVLGSLPVLRDLVEARLLVNPFRETVTTTIGYDIVTTRRALERREVRNFADWIIAEAHSEKTMAAGIPN